MENLPTVRQEMDRALMEIEEVERITGGKYVRTRIDTCYYCRYKIVGGYVEIIVAGNHKVRVHDFLCYKEVDSNGG